MQNGQELWPGFWRSRRRGTGPIPTSPIRARRGRRSQVEIAQMAGISQGFVSDLESGKKRLTPEVARRLAPALGTTADQLVVAEHLAKNIALEDVYRPHGYDELEGIVSANVLAGLDPEKPYGIYWFGKRRTSYKPGRGKSRVVEMTPRESWIAVPVDLTGSGLDRVVVDRARAAVKDNRSPSKRSETGSGRSPACSSAGSAAAG